MWIGLEINMVRFILIIYKQYDQKIVEVCLKYFFVQSLGSAILLGIFYIDKEFVSSILVLILRYKIGGGPFYFWFISVCRGLRWISIYLLLSFQKLIPIILLNFFIRWVVWIIIIIRLLIGTLGSFNQKFLKTLIGFSSVNHLGWILLCNLYRDIIWLIYLFIYRLIMFCILIILSKNEFLYLFFIDDWRSKIWFAFGLLRIAGIPPLLGFFLKWIAFIYILNLNIIIIVIIVIISVIIFYVYFRIIYDVFMYYNVRGYSNIYSNDIYYFFNVDLINIFGLVRGLMLVFYFYYIKINILLTFKVKSSNMNLQFII